MLYLMLKLLMLKLSGAVPAVVRTFSLGHEVVFRPCSFFSDRRLSCFFSLANGQPTMAYAAFPSHESSPHKMRQKYISSKIAFP